MRDDIQITIYSTGVDSKGTVIRGAPLEKGSGNWMSYIKWDCDDKVWWHQGQDIEVFKAVSCLPSDTHQRLDYQHIAADDIKAAQMHRDQ